MVVYTGLYNPGRKVDLYCGRPLIIFHDPDHIALQAFCSFTPPWARCTRIVITQKTPERVNPDVIFVGDQTQEEIAIWYASADCVVTHKYKNEVLASGSICVFSNELDRVLIAELKKHGYD